MSDCEEGDFFWESWISPGKRKRKKNSQKDKQCVKHRNSIPTKTDESIQKKKKKKKSKFKEAMEGRKEKKKEKKGKKNKSSAALNDSLILVQGYTGASGPSAQSQPESSRLCGTDKPKPDLPTQGLKKKRKKKVVFDLSLGNIHVKHPKFASPSPTEIILSENEAVRDSESCSQVTVMGHSQGQPHDNDSQCASDDINSQDLFITQKTFRAPPSEPSSGEVSDKAVTTTPQLITQPKRGLHSSGDQIKHHEGSDTCLQSSRVQQRPKKTEKNLQGTKTEEERSHFAQQNPKKGTLSFQGQMRLKTNLSEEKEVFGLVHVKPSVLNPYLDDPVVVKPSLDVGESKKLSCTSSPLHTDEPRFLPLMPKASISTQTENFFTTELSSYLNFCHKRGGTLCFENLKPLDLSLPQRARKDLGGRLSVKVSGTEIKEDEGKCSDQKSSSLPNKMKGFGHKDPNLRPSCSSGLKDVEVKKEPPGRQRWPVSAQGKGKTMPSPQSESEPKSADTTTSSEDNEPPCGTGKLDLTQVRAVQMRLNESFFFKTKGEGQSLRPDSPLMKLAQSREVKSRKGH